MKNYGAEEVSKAEEQRLGSGHGSYKRAGRGKYGEIMKQYSIFRNQNKALEDGSHEKRYGSCRFGPPILNPQSGMITT